MSRRIGRWQYGENAGLNPGWRLDGTNLVLDYSLSDGSCGVVGCYILWTAGREGDPIDHYLGNAMAYVEQHVVPAMSGGERGE